MLNEWKYYNHALIPTTPPHIDVKLPQGNFWKALNNGGAERLYLQDGPRILIVDMKQVGGM